MSRALVMLSTALLLGAAPNLAHAGEQGAAAGAVTGAVTGAVVGGPVGAVVGAVVGGIAGGTVTGPSSYASDQVQSPYAPAERRSVRAAGPGGGTLLHDPESTGSIVMETTCVRDAHGTPRCRRVR
jgi:hypothetical protein